MSRASVSGKAPRAKTLGERLAVDKLHGQKIEIALPRGGGMNFENLAYVGMADLAGVAYFRRQPFAETGLGALDGDTTLEPFVHGFINHSHSALRDFTQDAESAFKEIVPAQRDVR